MPADTFLLGMLFALEFKDPYGVDTNGLPLHDTSMSGQSYSGHEMYVGFWSIYATAGAITGAMTVPFVLVALGLLWLLASVLEGKITPKEQIYSLEQIKLPRQSMVRWLSTARRLSTTRRSSTHENVKLKGKEQDLAI
jgi:hypothetical protein